MFITLQFKVGSYMFGFGLDQRYACEQQALQIGFYFCLGG